MKLRNGDPHILIGVAVAIVCTIAFSGCLPSTPTKLALYYQKLPTASEEGAWIKRWLPDTGTTEATLQQQSDGSMSNVELITAYKGNGKVIELVRNHYPSTSWSVLVPDNPNPTPTLLYTRAPGPNGIPSGGLWHEWSPDGKYIGMQIGRIVFLSTPDGIIRLPIGTANGMEDSRIPTYHAWSPDSTMLAFTRERDILDVVDIYTGERFTDSVASDLGAMYAADPAWFYNSSNMLLYVLEDYDFFTTTFYPRGYVPWPPQVETDLPWDVWNSRRTSHGGDRAATIMDTDNDGDDDVIIVDEEEGTILQTFTNFGHVVDRELSWSPDDSKLIVTTNVRGGDITRIRMITFDNGAVDTLLEKPAAPAAQKVIIEWSPDSRHVFQGYDTYGNDDGITTDGLLFDTQDLASGALPLPAWRDIAWAPDSSHLAMAVENGTSLQCSLLVVKAVDSPRKTSEIDSNIFCSVYWTTPDA